MKAKVKTFIQRFSCLIAVFCLDASGNAQTRDGGQSSWDQGNCQQTAEHFSKKAGNTMDSKDSIQLKLEEGAAWRAAGKYEQSNQAFELAEDRVNYYDEQAKIKVSSTAKSTILGPSALPYEGHAYDKIMMNTYKALNYMQVGDFEKARVELNRALERQREAVELNAARLEKAQEKAKKQENQPDMEQIQSDEEFQSDVKKEYSDLDAMKAYADYVNPLTVYLDGLFFMTQSSGNSDYERSRKSFERVLAMIGENKFIRQDVEAIQKAQAGQSQTPVTYVIFETGQSPVRKEIHMNTPVALAGASRGAGKVDRANVAFPKLDLRGQPAASLTVSANGTKESAVLLSSMDSVIATEFKNERPVIMTQTLSAYFARGAIGSAAGTGGKKGLGGALANVAITTWLKMVNHADLRTWTTLPKEFHYCRMATPVDRKLELATANSAEKTAFTVGEGNVNLVWVQSIRENAPL